MRKIVAIVAAFAAITVLSDDGGPEATAENRLPTFSFSASADVETAYICRGYVWDSRPYSAQEASAEVGFGPFGSVAASIWTYSAMARGGHSAEMDRYAYAEADYLIRYYYDIDFAEGWRLRNGIGRQWVTNPGFTGGHTVCDWQALQVLKTPYVTPYWRLRLLRRPIDETYWVVGVKRSFEILDNLSLTVDLFGDLGDGRHYANLYGPNGTKQGASWRGGLQAMNLVFRLDYALTKYIGLYAFVGQFCLVHDDARDAVKAMKAPEARRDLTYGGIGVSISF